MSSWFKDVTEAVFDGMADLHDTITAPMRVDHGLIARDRREREERRSRRKERRQEEEGD